MDILFLLILGHLFGDYALQSDRMAAQKKLSGLILTGHVLVYVVCIYGAILAYSLLYQPGLSFKTATFIFMAALFVQHWIQDYFKSRYSNGSKQLYYFDQMVHFSVLYIYRIFIYR